MGQWWAVPPTKTENDARMTTVICVICRPVNEMYRPGEVLDGNVLCSLS